MNPITANKARLLRETADLIEKKAVEWDWENGGKCTLGHLFQVMSNLSPEDLNNQLSSMRFDKLADWSSRTEYCLATGFPLSDVVTGLFDAGFTLQEMIDIEWLGKENKKKQINPTEVDEVIEYLRQYANKLELAELNKVSEKHKVTVGVGL